MTDGASLHRWGAARTPKHINQLAGIPSADLETHCKQASLQTIETMKKDIFSLTIILFLAII